VHISHFLRCITGLPGDKADLDNLRLSVAYYCLSGLDILDAIEGNKKISPQDLVDWRQWFWNSFIRCGSIGGFRSGTLGLSPCESEVPADRYDQPHLIITYTALLSLSILRDDFSRLDRSAVLSFLRSVQHPDGSFSPLPLGVMSSENDLRLTFCAFAISSMLDDWSMINVDLAIQFIRSCRTYEGGYGEAPGREAQGGPTYCALASLKLAALYLHSKGESSLDSLSESLLSPEETRETVRWLIQKQKGGFQGRTGKQPDACYCFWCGASLKILNAGCYVDNDANGAFLLECQYKHGGMAKEPGEPPDPYHTYLSLAALSLYPPSERHLSELPNRGSLWSLKELDPLLNLRSNTALWARQHIPEQTQQLSATR